MLLVSTGKANNGKQMEDVAVYDLWWKVSSQDGLVGHHLSWHRLFYSKSCFSYKDAGWVSGWLAGTRSKSAIAFFAFRTGARAYRLEGTRMPSPKAAWVRVWKCCLRFWEAEESGNVDRWSQRQRKLKSDKSESTTSAKSYSRLEGKEWPRHGWVWFKPAGNSEYPT